jgi:hypothetical protein
MSRMISRDQRRGLGQLVRTALCLPAVLVAVGCEQNPLALPPEAPVANPAPPTQPAAAPPVANQPQTPAVELSTGVALPQTGPTGILMAFSVDYVFTPGPNPSVQYGWVIQRRRGQPIVQPVTLKQKGTLELLAPGWRPEEGPFQCFLVEVRKDGARRQISGVEALR